MTLLGVVAALLGAAALAAVIAALLFVRIATARYIISKRYDERAVRKGLSVPEHLKPHMDEIRAEGERFMALKPERVCIQSYDGLKLCGLYLEKQGSKQAILLIHGLRCPNPFYDFASLLRFYEQCGMSILLISQRAHGQSEGKRICYGVKERYDCQSWLRWLQKRAKPDAMFLGGMSMGTATALMATELELPHSLRGVIADCGYTTPWEAFGHVLKAIYHLPRYPLLPLGDIGIRLFAGFGLRDASALKAMSKNTRLPVLFIHGGEDKLVPSYMGRANYLACKASKRLLIVPSAEHTMSAWVDPDGVQAEISSFIEECIGEV